MENALKEAIELLKRLPEKGVEKAIGAIRDIKDECERDEKTSLKTASVNGVISKN
ncbi:MAG: hypothetical protein FWF44_04665 [Defluviitaleaceae bacterium]|nr:hypothetical protein [Defluviitaleaceae bacterium]